MAEYSLTAIPPLGGLAEEFDSVSVREITGRALVSIAVPLGGEKKLARAVASKFKAELPPLGSSSTSGDGKFVFFATQIDQFFLLFDHQGGDADTFIAKKLNNSAYVSNQSDSWTMIEISGPKCREALERICLLDLHPEKFVIGDVARTQMEHLGVIIHAAGPDSFLLMSARSSAQSFYHAIETSIHNITN